MECPICNRDLELTFHHFYPKCLHKKLRKNKKHRILKLEDGVLICNACHKHIHKMFSNKELCYELNTLKSIKETDIMRKWIPFISKTKKNIY